MKMVTWDVNYLYAGKPLPERYDWKADPKGIGNEGHIPHNRCFHCGSRFIGSKIVAFCNICDHAMAVGGEDMLMGFSFERRDARIRIPDDTTEEQYTKKLQDMEKPEKPKAVFTRADELDEMI